MINKTGSWCVPLCSSPDAIILLAIHVFLLSRTEPFQLLCARMSLAYNLLSLVFKQNFLPEGSIIKDYYLLE